MKTIRIINILVFLSITATVVSIFYEGMTLEWYSFVPALMITADSLFILATILHLFFTRKNKLLFKFNIVSTILIFIALITKFAGIDHPKWAATIWHFYILFLYGIQVVIDVYKSRILKNNK